MLKYNTKPEMVSLIRSERERLEKKLLCFTTEEMALPGMMDEWSIKDILMHLVDWEQRVIGWYQTGLRGEVSEIPAPGYNWAQLPALNRKCFETHRNMTVDEVMMAFQSSHNEILDLVNNLSEEELFAHKKYVWTKNWRLAEWIASATHKHYDWACKNIRPAKIRSVK